jgi:glucokinase
VIKRETGINEVLLINDLEATAYGLSGTGQTDITVIHSGDKNISGNMCVIAPGTGLGEAGLYHDGRHYHPFATEGGHAGFSPVTETDIELYYYLEKIYGHVSWERLISGPGIIHIYQFLRNIKKRKVPHWLAEKLTHGEEAAVISQYAADQQCGICAETMSMFFRYLAVESANLVLKLKATGGLFIGGGIVPKVRYLVNRDEFMKNFLDAGRMRRLLKKVPVKIILDDRTALKGAALYGAYA